MFRIIIAIFASGLVGYMCGLAQERHYGHQMYLEGLKYGCEHTQKVMIAYAEGKRKATQEDMEIIEKVCKGEFDEKYNLENI